MICARSPRPALRHLPGRDFSRTLLVVVATLACAIAANPKPALATGFSFRGSEGFEVALKNEDGTPDTQAGSHPFEFTIATRLQIAYTQIKDFTGEIREYRIAEGGPPRDIEAGLPAGFVGAPGATSQCPESQLHNGLTLNGNEGTCPADTQVGYAQLELAGPRSYHFDIDADVFNVAPRPGEPAEFGMNIE
jgi:hypothetical protein